MIYQVQLQLLMDMVVTQQTFQTGQGQTAVLSQQQMFVMVSKTPNSKGFTFPEILIAFALFILIISATILVLSPSELQARARDKKRLSDLSKLDRAINEFKLENERYPGLSDITKESTVLPDGSTSPLENATSGWLHENMQPYLTALPLDPINDDIYHYYFLHNGVNYEINARLEYLDDYAQTDGGDDANLYELGDDMSIL